MAQVVNVILDNGSNDINLNKHGLISLRFSKVLGSPSISSSTVLSKLDISLFDITGHTLLKILQQSGSKLRLRYGFDDDLSPIYSLTIVKINTTYNNLGCMISIGAVASQQVTTFPSEIYKKGESVLEIIKKIANRNNWYIGDKDISTYVDVSPNLTLPETIVKPQTMSDIDFLLEEIKPICELTIVNIHGVILESDYLTSRVDFYDILLYNDYVNNRTTLKFLKNLERTEVKNVWEYSYGVDTESKVISLTNTMDQTFLVKGLTLQIPYTASDKIKAIAQGEQSLDILDILTNYSDDIIKVFELCNLTSFDLSDFKWTLDFYEVENLGNKTLEQIIMEKFRDVVSTFNKLELTVIGNYKILPGDLVDLRVALDPTTSEYKENIFLSGLWKVVKIDEEIGMSGYKTTLTCVRDLTNLKEI